MKQKIRTVIFLAACAVCVSILWKHTHSVQAPKQAQTGGAQAAKKETGQTLEFPAEYKEKVSDKLSFNASVDTGDADLNQIGCRKATIQKFDEKTVKNCFLDPDVKYDSDTGRESGWEGTDVISKIYNHEGVGFLNFWENGFLYSSPLMDDIWNLMSASYGDTKTNYKYQFSKDLDLDGFSKQDALKALTELLGRQGVAAKQWKAVESYTLDAASMGRQEKNLISDGSIDLNMEQGHGKWRRREEGYYFFIEECVDGVPLVPARTLANMGNSWSAPTDNYTYITRDGVAGFRLCDWFEAKEGDGHYKLAPFDDVIQSLKAKYGSQLIDDSVCVEKLKLYLYPISMGKGVYMLRPVWICRAVFRTPGEDGGTGYESLAALDAVTGAELEELK